MTPCTQKPLSWKMPAPSPQAVSVNSEQLALRGGSPGRWGRSGCRRRGTPPGSSPPHSPGQRRGWRLPSLQSRSKAVSRAPSWQGLGSHALETPRRSSHRRGQGWGSCLQSPASEAGSPQHPQVRVSLWKTCSLLHDSKSPKPSLAPRLARGQPAGEAGGLAAWHTQGSREEPGRTGPTGRARTSPAHRPLHSRDI